MGMIHDDDVCVCACGRIAFLEVTGRGQEAAGVTRKLQGELGGARKHQDRRNQEAPGSARSSAVTPPEIFRGFILTVWAVSTQIIPEWVSGLLF